MAPRPPIQAVIEEQAELDTNRRNWRMVLFNEDGTPFTGGGSEEIVDLTYGAGWGPLAAGGYEPVRRRKSGRLITLSGAAECAGAKATGSVIGTLPEGWRPEGIVLGPGRFYDGSSFVDARFDVKPNGDITLEQAGLGAGGWVPFQASFIAAEEVVGIS